jgi:hypothetical protein
MWKSHANGTHRERIVIQFPDSASTRSREAAQTAADLRFAAQVPSEIPRRDRLQSRRLPLHPVSDISSFKFGIGLSAGSTQAAPNLSNSGSNPPQISQFLIDSALQLEIAGTYRKQRIEDVSNR